MDAATANANAGMNGGGANMPPQGAAAGGGAGSGAPMYGNVRSASLYVGDLAPSTTESQLFEAFSQIGKIQSIRILRDAITRQSLGYAYVNFYDTMDAERAIDVLNFQPINGRPCRVMWVQRDPYLRKTGVGNIVIKNLHPTIDNKTLFDTFSVFGNILSCKVVTDEHGNSRGFGFVHFDSEASAQGCITDVNGKIIGGQEVVVEPFKRGHKVEALWTNLYVKNVPLDWDDARFKAEFEKYGEITSAVLRKVDESEIDDQADDEEEEEGEEGEEGGKKKEKKEEKNEKKGEKAETAGAAATPAKEGGEKEEEGKDGKKKKEEGKQVLPSGAKNRGFGFVNFVEHESAKKAMEEMNGKKFPEAGSTEADKEMYVRRLQTKKERQKELRDKHALIKKERLTKFQGCNLYIKNLDESLDDEWLRTNFGKFGTITSARVMRDQTTGASKGFGFVCYSTPEEASAAIQKMNNKMFMGKPVYVALSQVASQRREMLAVSFQQQQQQRGMIPPMQNAPFYPPPAAMGLQQPAYLSMGPYGQPMRGPGGMLPQRGMPLNPGMMRPMYRMPDYRRQDMGGMEGGPGGMVGGGRPGGPGPKQPYNQRGQGQQGGGGGGPRGRQPGGRMVQGGPGGMMGGGMPPHMQGQMGGPQEGYPQEGGQGGGGGGGQQGGAIDPTRLASASVEEQKTILGEQLYPLIVRREPELAGKITGMILELDNTEILHLLESPELLDEKVQEAIKVLQEFNTHVKDGSE